MRVAFCCASQRNLQRRLLTLTVSRYIAGSRQRKSDLHPFDDCCFRRKLERAFQILLRFTKSEATHILLACQTIGFGGICRNPSLIEMISACAHILCIQSQQGLCGTLVHVAAARCFDLVIYRSADQLMGE